MKRIALLACTALGLAGPASAHDLWLTPGPSGGVQVHFGHPNEPEMPARDKLIGLSAYTPAGTTALSAKAVEGAPVLAAALDGDALVAASYDNGYWVRLGDGTYRNASKRLYPQSDKSLWSVKFAKAALGASAPWDRIVGQTLEIVPLEAPATASGKIRVRVLFEGKPLAGSIVLVTDGQTFKAASDQARATTDAAGIAVVPLRVAGPQLLEVDHRVAPSQTPALADSDTYASTFAFVVTDPKTN